MLGNPGSTSGPEPPPGRDSFLGLSSSSLSLEPQPQKAQSPSIIRLLSTLLRNDKHNSSYASTRLLIENIGSTSRPETLPAAPEVGEILGRNEAQGLQHNSMRSLEPSWLPPPSLWYKFNVGAEVHYTAFLAAVARNDEGIVVEANVTTENVTSSLVAEALAFRYAVILIKQYSVRRAIVEGDAPLVVNALKDRKTDAPSEINDIVKDVFAMLDNSTDTIVDFSCVNKSCNTLVYDCTKWAARNRFWGLLPICWFTGASFIGPSGV
ncbi:hypothetical protein SO802_022036 [Lithocarpus litseifolius]|uniref:RNase H type-1 domain-containing protein n=1 Tax=Lithocarpus litseifolius TaxID=425828 RepID=A0AAW2CLF5_9ROSI